MHRRDLLKSGLFTTALAALSPKMFGSALRQEQRNLFFDSSELPRIRANSDHPLLQTAYRSFRREPLERERAILDRARRSNDFVNDLRDLTEMLNRQSVVLLTLGTEAEPDRRALVRDAIEGFLALPQWDYFMDGRGQILGFQRAPASIISTLFAVQILGDEQERLRERLLADLPAKGCEPCYWSLWGMLNRETTRDWQFDPDYYANYDVDLSNWPRILNETNLKAIPIAGLGLGALALRDRDDRYDRWMNMAVSSAKSYLELFKPDGSYFEGIGYADYSLRNLFIFFEAHLKLDGSIDWLDQVNYYGFTEYATCMQMGQRMEGHRRDIVNFSDANFSFHPSTLLWIANRSRDPLAQHAALNYSERRDFTDWLWLYPEQPTMEPPDHLLNKRFDLDWIVCRSGWKPEDSVVAFRSGRPSNHEHADRNSFIFKAYGERLLTDHYGASYDWRQKGWLLRLTEAHNAVLINGKGHQYHDGSEGTPASKAAASIVRYVDRGDLVFWTSDATPAYALVHPGVKRVHRSLCFLKPDIVVILDSVEADIEVEVSVRFHPDNSDGLASLDLTDGGFLITRPMASLTAKAVGEHPLHVSTGVLDVPPADLAHLGDGLLEARDRDASYVFAEVLADAARRARILTVLAARSGSQEAEVSVTPGETGWAVSVDGVGVQVIDDGSIPEFRTWRR